MNILTMVVLVVFFLFAVSGLKKGLVKKLAGMVALVASAFLVSAALPYITEFLKTETPVYEYLVEQCQYAVGKQASRALLGGENGLDGQSQDGQSLGGQSLGGIDREQIKTLMEQYGMDSSVVDGMSDDQLQELAGQYFQDYLNQNGGEAGAADAAGMSSMTKIQQTQMIQNLPIPSFLKDMMINYNNGEGYTKLEVTDFGGYVVHFFANIILNIIAFVIALLAAQLVLWTAITALDLFARLPVLHFINHLGGLAVGILQGLLVVWMIFLLISVFSATEIGMNLMNMIEESVLLKPLYDSNLFLKMVVQGISELM